MTSPNPVVQARNAKNRRKGKSWEYQLRVELRKQGIDTEALKLTGTKDEGDLVLRSVPGMADFIVIEAKNAALKPADFVRQALLEAEHFAEHRGLDPERVRGVAVVKRHGMNWKDAYVITTLGSYLGIG